MSLRLHSITFAHAASATAVPLRLPDSMVFTGDRPEWVDAVRHDPVACIRGGRPTVRVVFARAGNGEPSTGAWRIGAQGRGGPGVLFREAALQFDHHGHSAPIEFTLDAALPDAIGTVHLDWEWVGHHGDASHALGATRHVCHLLRQQPVSPATWAVAAELAAGPHGDPDRIWIWAPLAEWTCAWAAGLTDDKAICDAVIAHLPASGLRYAEAAWDVGGMLKARGGYCGGWYRMFQALAGVHGVAVERRCYKVDWRVEAGTQARWCAIVVDAAGINRDEPAEHPSAFHDEDVSLAETSPVTTCHERRYRFWGLPGALHDGHSINFLRHDGRWHLYDACFFREPVSLEDFELPVPDPARRVPVEALGSFKRAYLDRAVHHMLGSLEHNGHLYRTLVPDTDDPEFHGAVTRNGLTVRTSLLPDADQAVTFYWTH